MSNIIVGGSGDMTFQSTALIWAKVIGTGGTGQRRLTRKEKVKGKLRLTLVICHMPIFKIFKHFGEKQRILRGPSNHLESVKHSSVTLRALSYH